MDWRDDIASGLPAPRGDEPADLRRDIADELADHLACAMTRERAGAPDESAARRAVLARFGSPRLVAYKLYWDAMKEKIMKDRLMIGALVILTLASLAALGLSWNAMRQNSITSTAMLKRLDEIVSRVDEAAIPPHRSVLKINVREGAQPDKPVGNVKFYLSGKEDSTPENQGSVNKAVAIDSDGNATMKLRPGKYQLYYPYAPWGGSWRYGAYKFERGENALFGGEASTWTVLSPPPGELTSETCAVKVDLAWPQELNRLTRQGGSSSPSDYYVGCWIARDPANTNSWRGDLIELVLQPDGQIIPGALTGYSPTVEQFHALGASRDFYDCQKVFYANQPGMDPFRSTSRPEKVTLTRELRLHPGKYQVIATCIRRLEPATALSQSELFSENHDRASLFVWPEVMKDRPRFEVKSGQENRLHIELPEQIQKAVVNAFAPDAVFELKMQQGEVFAIFHDSKIWLGDFQPDAFRLTFIGFGASSNSRSFQPNPNLELKKGETKRYRDLLITIEDYVYVPKQPGDRQADTERSRARIRVKYDPQSPAAASLDPDLTQMIAGKIQNVLPITKDCMILKYIPLWNNGEVDNIAVANNDGGVRMLLDWPAVAAADALTSGRQFLLALYSRETKDRFKDKKDGKDAILASEITADWPELTSWKSQPPIEKIPAARFDFTPGNGWKLFDVTPLVRARAKSGAVGHGIMLHFADETASGNKQEWSGYACVSREGKFEKGQDWTGRHPLLLVVAPPSR